MNWKNINTSEDSSYFEFEGIPIFNKKFYEVLKFHAPGFAPVKDESGSYHIDVFGKQLYSKRFLRTFGFYCNRAAVVEGLNWFHLTEKGEKAYSRTFKWTGNYQENLCTVRDENDKYFHIHLDGTSVYNDSYLYAGDYKDGIACVKGFDGFYRHINKVGNFINSKEFLDLGVFHKNYATAKDKNGWYHINKKGDEIYQERYLGIEPFYNGYSLVTKFDYDKIIIDEEGKKVISA